jgi:AsmA protein
VPDTTHTTASVNNSGVILVPKNLDLDFTAQVKQVKYTDMVINDATGHLMMRNDSIILQETGFTLIDAPFSMNAIYTVVNPQRACFGYHINAQDFDVHKAYTHIKLFHDLASSAEHAEGLVSIDYDLSGSLCSGMVPVYPSLKGGGVISAQKIKMHGFKLLNAISKETGKEEVGGDPDVSEVNIKSTIANNLITIERTKVKLALFHAQFEGQVSFDKAMDLKFRLGLPPRGLIGIPMTITGTEDNPKIKLGKGKEGDELKETPDKEN